MAWQAAESAWSLLGQAGTFLSKAEAIATAAEEGYDAANSFAHKFTNDVIGSTDIYKRVSGVKRKFRGDPIDPSTTINPPPKIHRSINTSQANMPANQSSGQHQDEVAVMPHHGPMSKIVEDYHTIKLTYYDRDLRFAATPGTNGFFQYLYRLNSIYDVNESLGGQQQPLGRDTWAAIYQYYRVLSCEMDVKIVNRQSVNTLLAGVVLEEDDANLTFNTSNFMMRKNAIRRIIPGTTYANPSTANIVYKYNPGSWDHHVQETGVEERWTPIGETPSNQHRAILRLIGSDGSDAIPNETDWEVFVTMKYVVQFREANKTILTQGFIP